MVPNHIKSCDIIDCWPRMEHDEPINSFISGRSSVRLTQPPRMWPALTTHLTPQPSTGGRMSYEELFR